MEGVVDMFGRSEEEEGGREGCLGSVEKGFGVAGFKGVNMDEVQGNGGKNILYWCGCF